MKNGISRSWTPEQEAKFNRLLDTCTNFAERHMVMIIRDLAKFDHRTKEGRRAIEQARLRIATATDEDMEQLAIQEARIKDDFSQEFLSQTLKRLKELRDAFRRKGIKTGAQEV